jgi:1-deoxy-D-xylulose-5-phosphate synthase
MVAGWEKPFEEIETGKARLLASGSDIAVLSIGHPGNFVTDALKIVPDNGISAEHYDMRFVNPIDTGVLHQVFRKFKKVLTVEDGFLKGGFGSAVIEFMCDNGYSAEVRRLGIPDYFVEQGTQEELIRECGFDTASIVMNIREMLGKNEEPAGKGEKPANQ